MINLYKPWVFQPRAEAVPTRPPVHAYAFPPPPMHVCAPRRRLDVQRRLLLEASAGGRALPALYERAPRPRALDAVYRRPGGKYVCCSKLVSLFYVLGNAYGFKKLENLSEAKALTGHISWHLLREL